MPTRPHTEYSRLEQHRTARQKMATPPALDHDEFLIDEDDRQDIGPGLRQTLHELAQGAGGFSRDD